MPIKGLQSDQPGLARAGIIRLGYKVRSCPNPKCKRQVRTTSDVCPACGASVKQQSTYPTEAPFFVLDDAPGVAEAIGTTEPTELKILFPFDDVDRCFPAFMQHYIASALTCRGDGERIVYAIDPTTGKAVVRDGVALVDFNEGQSQYGQGQFMPCPGLERNRYPKCQACKPQALLLVMLQQVPRLAYFQISTTSSRNIRELTEQLNKVRQDVNDIIGVPRLTGVPFILKRVKRSISAPNLNRDGSPKTDRNGKPQPRQRVEKYFLELEIDPDWVLKMFKAQRQLSDPLTRFALPVPSQPAPVADIVSPGPAVTHAEPPVWEPTVVDGDFEPAEPEEVMTPDIAPAPVDEPVQPPAPINGHGRPFQPAQLKEAIDKITTGVPFKDTETGQDLPVGLHPKGDKVANLVSSLFQSAWPGNDEAEKMYHSCLKWLTGKSSSRDLAAAEANALLTWLVGKDNVKNLTQKELFKLAVTEPVIEEINRVHREAMLAAGQVDMFTGADPLNELDEYFPREEGD